MTDADFTAQSDFIVDLLCRVDDMMSNVKKHSQSKLYPSEVVTLGMLFALKGRGNRAFYAWAKANLRSLFPSLPDRTRLFRLFAAHHNWTDRFLAAPSLLGVADSYGVELIHPRRQGRSQKQIGKKGKSNHRWIVGCKLGFVLNRFGLVCAWDVKTANVYDADFAPLIEQFDEQMLILADSRLSCEADSNFHAKVGDPANLKICKRGQWNDRMLVETVLSMLSRVCQIKKVGHRVWSVLKARLAFCLAAFNLCALWDGPESGRRRLRSPQHGTVRALKQALKLAPMVIYPCGTAKTSARADCSRACFPFLAAVTEGCAPCCSRLRLFAAAWRSWQPGRGRCRTGRRAGWQAACP